MREHARLAAPDTSVTDTSKPSLLRFGAFELDLEAEQLLKSGRLVRLQPQPFKLLCLLTSQPGKVVTREEIRAALWEDDTFVDFEQGVNFAVKQVREALNDPAEHAIYVQTVPKRGYRFMAPVAVATPTESDVQPSVDTNLDKALWTNIAELRLAEARSNKRHAIMLVALGVVLLFLIVLLFARSS